MSDFSDAITSFMDGPADESVARGLKGEDGETLLALVKALAEAKKRGHLEALGAAGLGKDVKKAARKAAYKLKSAGVEAEVQVTATAALDLSVKANLDNVAVASALGLRGQGWLALGDMLGAQPVEAIIAQGGVVEEVTLLESLTPGRLKNFMRDVKGEGAAAPVLVDASVAVALIEDLQAAIEASGELPQRWPHVVAWREAAASHGASGARAREALADKLADIDINLTRTTHKLLDRPETGVSVPPETALSAMFAEIGEATHSELELTEKQFRERLEGLADSAADAWLGDEGRRLALASWLDFSATVVLANGDEESALQLLYVADEIRGGDKLPHEIHYVQEAFRRLVDYDAAWSHYDDFKNNEHHHHGHHHHGEADEGPGIIVPG